MITPAQCRAARGLLEWSQKTLALKCTVSIRTIVTFERGETTPTPLNLKTFQEKLEEGGVEFTNLVEGEHQEGVRLKWGYQPPKKGINNDPDRKSNEHSKGRD